MGLQDRDYYREKHKEAHQSPRPLNRKFGGTSTGIKYLLYPLITIVALWYGADTLLDKINGITLIPAPIVDRKEKPLDMVSGGVILKTDRQGHFRGTALVNNVPMPFLIDTGATTTAIPAKMAIAANLPLGSAVQSKTAGGQVRGLTSNGTKSCANVYNSSTFNKQVVYSNFGLKRNGTK